MVLINNATLPSTAPQSIEEIRTPYSEVVYSVTAELLQPLGQPRWRSIIVITCIAGETNEFTLMQLEC